MSGAPFETCWAVNECWNNNFRYKVAFCWLFILSHTTMHGSMNIKVNDLREQNWLHSISTEYKRLLSSPEHSDRIMHSRSLIFGRFWVQSRWESGQEAKLTTHLHRVQRLRMSGAITLLPIYALMAWTGTNLFFALIVRLFTQLRCNINL
jgi:hypothetical protein